MTSSAVVTLISFVLKSSFLRILEIRARIFKWSPVEFSGVNRRKKRCVGRPSMDSKLTPFLLSPKPRIRESISFNFPCGIPIPPSMPVLPSLSRSERILTSLSVLMPVIRATGLESSSRTPFLSFYFKSVIIVSLCKTSIIFMYYLDSFSGYQILLG